MALPVSVKTEPDVTDYQCTAAQGSVIVGLVQPHGVPSCAPVLVETIEWVSAAQNASEKQCPASWEHVPFLADPQLRL